MKDNKYSVCLSWNEGEWKFFAISDEYPRLTGFGLTRLQALEDLEKQVRNTLDK